jgi:hypothetical protein
MKRLTGGRIAGLYVGNRKGTVKQSASSVLLTLDGIEGDAHAGRTHKTGAREPAFRRGTLVANTRQLSLVSVEELRDIASRLGIAHIDPAWVAANIATEGAGPITQLPPGTLLGASSGATIYIAELNSPCRAAARLIAQHVACAGDASFVRHAKGAGVSSASYMLREHCKLVMSSWCCRQRRNRQRLMGGLAQSDACHQLSPDRVVRSPRCYRHLCRLEALTGA